MVQAALRGEGVALVPVSACSGARLEERAMLVQPFATEVDLGSYWLTRLMSRSDLRP